MYCFERELFVMYGCIGTLADKGQMATQNFTDPSSTYQHNFYKVRGLTLNDLQTHGKLSPMQDCMQAKILPCSIKK
jgi:hypothetical protein